MGGKGRLLLVGLVGNGQFGAAFSAAAGQDLTAVLSAHAAAETVLVYATTLGGLKRSFHGFVVAGRAANRPEDSLRGAKVRNVAQSDNSAGI